MFLALTDECRWWRTDTELVLINRWCLSETTKTEVQKLGFSVMPNPWHDRRRMRHVAEYMDLLNERVLLSIARYLNEVHGLNAEPRFWRILIGPWLTWHVRLYFDRYVHIQDAKKLYRDFDTLVLPPESFVVPKDTTDFFSLIESARYNWQMMSQILRDIGYAFEAIRESPSSPINRTQDLSLRNPAGQKDLPPLRPIVMLHELYCGQETAHELIQGANPIACEFVTAARRFAQMPDARMNQERQGLAGMPTQDEFEALLVKGLPQHFPTLWLESFQQARSLVAGLTKLIPSVIVSANAWYDNEVFKFFAAEASNRGARLVSLQHGSGYGVFLNSHAETFERRISDRYLSWGWRESNDQEVRPVPSPQVTDLKRKVAQAGSDSKENRGSITFFATAFCKYRQLFQSDPVFDQLDRYFEWELRFLARLPDALRSRLIYRPYMHDYGWGATGTIRSRFPTVLIDDVRSWSATLPQRLKASRLVVIDHNSTTLLFTLALNIPTIMFWDPECWEVRDSAEPYFRELRRVGILWDTPEDAAAKAAEIYCDPAKWWGSADVQSVRERFTARYARASSEWISEWKQILMDELKLSQPRNMNLSISISRNAPRSNSDQASGAAPFDPASPPQEIGGYKVEIWKSLAEMRQIEYAKYWNDVEEERKKEWWILDGNIEKMESYLDRSFLLPQLRQLLEFVKARYGRKPEGCGADLAAGNLWGVPQMLKAGEVERIYAVEYSIHRITHIGPYVLKAYGVPKDKVVLCLGSFYELKLPTGALDFVFMSQAFHHADDPLRLLAEIRRVLRPSGLVFMIGEHVTEMPKVQEPYLRDLRARLSSAEARRTWKPLLPPDPVLGDHCYFDEEYDAMFTCIGFSYHNLRMPGSKFHSYVLVRDQGSAEKTDGRREQIGERVPLQGALSRLNTRLQQRSTV